MPPGDVSGSEAGLDIRRRRETEVRPTSRDRSRRRFDVSLKPTSSARAHIAAAMQLLHAYVFFQIYTVQCLDKQIHGFCMLHDHELCKLYSVDNLHNFDDKCCKFKNTDSFTSHAYYAALLPRRGPHIASHSVCPSVCLSVRLSVRPSRYRYRASRGAT